MKNVKQKGFIALMSAIIISVLLLTVTLTISMTGIFGRFNVLDSESKERSSALAEACADSAILDLAQSITPPSIIPVGSDNCSVVSTVMSGTQTNIVTQGVFNKAYTNLKVVIDSNYNIVSWEETPN